MADEEGRSQPIIIKRIKKGGHGHHGGAWKVAYADFVTAMMAFFLLLWLLNSVTEEQLQGISNYFAPTSLSKSTTGAGQILSGGTVIGEGAMPNATFSISSSTSMPPPTIGAGGEDLTDPNQGQMETDSEATARYEQEQFEQVAEELRQAIVRTPELAGLAQNILIDNTAEGLRIQLIDAEGLAMFPSGGSSMYEHTKRALGLVARAVQEMPQKISISGHTDAIPFNDASGWSNWELSADRALASRRALIGAGVPESRIVRVVGRAETDPLIPGDPRAAGNRRISIVLLRDLSGTPASPPSPPQSVMPGAAGKNAIKG
ncbi:MAG: Flagellar motor protein [Rhodospirillaceae bacterium]|nr:MAG: Flagellar motor protein [Rhodospirillaceae bacterium]